MVLFHFMSKYPFKSDMPMVSLLNIDFLFEMEKLKCEQERIEIEIEIVYPHKSWTIYRTFIQCIYSFSREPFDIFPVMICSTVEWHAVHCTVCCDKWSTSKLKQKSIAICSWAFLMSHTHTHIYCHNWRYYFSVIKISNWQLFSFDIGYSSSQRFPFIDAIETPNVHVITTAIVPVYLRNLLFCDEFDR